MKIYIILPIYNEEENLLPLLNGINNIMKQNKYRYEIIAYNDGSTDNSIKILKQNIGKIPIKILDNRHNRGLGLGVLSLINESLKLSKNENDIVICCDSDNTHNPIFMPYMIKKILDGYDLVIASRYLKDSRVVGVSEMRQFLSYIASLIMRFLFPIKGVKDYTCGYRAYSISILKKAKNKYMDKFILESNFSCMAEILIKLKFINVLAIEIPYILRYDYKKGESKMNVSKTIIRTILMMLKLKFLSNKIKKNKY